MFDSGTETITRGTRQVSHWRRAVNVVKIERWADREFAKDETLPIRVVYAPRGPLDFIDFNLPVDSVHTCFFGVLFVLVNGSIRLLRGDPTDPEHTWEVTEIFRY